METIGLVCRRISTCLARSATITRQKSAFCVLGRGIYNGRLPAVDLWDIYSKTKQKVEAQPLPTNQDPNAVFANNELDLGEISVYGFDYDYTLACYQESVHYLIYDMGREVLIRKHKYPYEIGQLAYSPGFAVRGLHCDCKKGFLLKIDSFHNIQMGTVYRGLQPVADTEVVNHYHGTHVPIEDLSGFHGTGPRMQQLMDLFALPEMALYSNVVQYFINNDIPFDPEYVFYDVKNAVQGMHSSGALHNSIVDNMELYLDPQNNIRELLHRLRSAGKQMFLITNSGVNFVDRGMRYLVGPDWNDLFDIIITNARKPKFFNETSRPFRAYNPNLGVKSWHKIDNFEKGQFYQEGNFYKLSTMTGWYGKRVLYFGDHVYTDLADPTLKHGWRTGAIIPELEEEISTLNSTEYKKSLRWLVTLQDLIANLQVYDDPESQQILSQWMKERNDLRRKTKEVFNPQFGSLFRTYHNATYFTRRLNRYADVYMSSVSSLLNYSLHHTFYPRRAALPHELVEPPYSMD